MKDHFHSSSFFKIFYKFFIACPIMEIFNSDQRKKKDTGLSYPQILGVKIWYVNIA